MKSKQSPLDAYVRRYGFVREKIERLQQLADDHFGHDPDASQWDNVGALGHLEAALDDLLAIFDDDRA